MEPNETKHFYKETAGTSFIFKDLTKDLKLHSDRQAVREIVTVVAYHFLLKLLIIFTSHMLTQTYIEMVRFYTFSHLQYLKTMFIQQKTYINFIIFNSFVYYRFDT